MTTDRPFDAAAVGGALGPGVDVFAVRRVDSTNDEVRRLARRSSSSAVLLVADEQSAGRGRHGHRWHSPRGGLYLSLLQRPARASGPLARWTIAAGTASCRALESCGARGVALEWPNDLVLDGRKLGGVLVESRTQGRELTELVIGVGLNLRPLARETEPSLRGRAAALAEALAPGAAPTRETLAAGIAEALLELTRSLARGAWPAVAREWIDRAADAPGRRVEVTEGGHRWRGTTSGLGDDGALLVRDDAGGDDRAVRLAGSVRPLGG